MSDAERLTQNQNGIFCYLVRKDQHSPDTVRNVLRREGIGRVWLTFAEVTVRDTTWIAFSLGSLRDEGSDGGMAVMNHRVPMVLSEGTSVALEMIVSPDGLEVFLSIFREGERGSRGRVLPETSDPTTSLLDGAELAELDALRRLNGPLADAGCEAFFAKREFSVPAWTDRKVDLFRFSERHGKGIEEEDGGKGGGRACFVSLDLEKLRQEVQGSEAGDLIYQLNHYRVGHRARLLGPMQADLHPCVDRLRRLPKNTPVAKMPELLDLLELLAMVHTWASTPGNRVAYLDEVFFPLLNLNVGDTLPPLDDEDVESMGSMPLTHVMADILPYRCPEGEIMESLDDGELAPLSGVLELSDVLGAEVDGAVFLLDHARVSERLRALDPDAFSETVEAFIRHMWEAERVRWSGDQEAWLANRLEMDQPELTAFFNTANELQTLIQMCEDNGLVLGLLFYA